MMNDMEKLLQKMEEMQHEINRLQAINEIQTLMGRYEILLDPQTLHRIPDEIFANWREDISMELSFGRFEGRESVRRLFTELMGPQNEPQVDGKPDLRGALYVHHLDTPMIEVAKDGQTAHAVWFSCGVETPYNKETGKRQSKWCYGRYSAEFIKGEQGWRVWHLHWFRCFMNDYYTSWADSVNMGAVSPGPLPEFAKPSVYNSTFDASREFIPVPSCPVPYETHENSDWVYAGWEDKIEWNK